MGFFSNLFKKKTEKSSQEQVDVVEDKDEESEQKDVKDN